MRMMKNVLQLDLLQQQFGVVRRKSSDGRGKSDVFAFRSFAFVSDGFIAHGTEQIVSTDADRLCEAKKNKTSNQNEEKPT